MLLLSIKEKLEYRGIKPRQRDNFEKNKRTDF